MFLLFLTIIIPILNCIQPSKFYCQPDDTNCWPSQTEINTFSNGLDGKFVIKNLSDPNYLQLIHTVQSQWTASYPSFIVLPSSHSDVVKCVSFASSYRIQISIQSTGHSYSGRNSANNSLNINLKNMQQYSFNKDSNPPTMTVETGMKWAQIYNLVNMTMPDYVIVGAGDDSVGPAGYSSYGGHSSTTTLFGLAGDHIKEAYLVDANANIIRVYNTSGENVSIDNLHWAMRGGGTGYAVILNITFELNRVDEPGSTDVWNQLLCVYPTFHRPFTHQEYVGYDVLYGFFDYVRSGALDPLWGGYMIFQYDADILDNYILLSMDYYGNASYAKKNIEPLMKLDPYGTPNTCSLTQYATFWDYEVLSPPDTNDGSLYIFNDMIPITNLTHDYADQLLLFYNESREAISSKTGFGAGSCATIVGGRNNLQNYPYGTTSSVTKGFRTSYFSHSMGVGWSPNATTETQNAAIQWSQKWEKIFWEFRGFGMYSNEENYNCDGCDWKQWFWGQQNYDKLLKVKQQFDPNNVFWCNHCVGSDL